MAHGFVRGGIGMHLGAGQSLMAEAHHAGLLAQAQHLHEWITQRVEVAAPELTDAAVIRLLVASRHTEGQILVAGPLDPAGGVDAGAVGVEQQQRQPLRGRLHLHPRVKPLLPARILVLGWDHDL